MSSEVETPEYVQIEPVGQCNLRCRMCPIQFRRDGPPHGPPAFMDFAVFQRLIDGFHNIRRLHLQGLGEPMMHPRFFDMVEYAAGKGIEVTTNSNLTLLGPERAERCVRSGLRWLRVSIDGATAETYEYIRDRSRLARVMENLRLLREARDRSGSRDPRLHLVVVAMRRNLDELPELVRLAHRWSMEEVFVQHLCHDFAEPDLPEKYRPMRDFVEAETLLGYDEERVNRSFELARATAVELGVKLRLPRVTPRPYPPGTKGRDRCDWPWKGAYISYRGEAMPCCMISTPDRLNFGNMAETGVEPIWNGEEYEEFRRRLDSCRPPDVCASCSLYRGTF